MLLGRRTRRLGSSLLVVALSAACSGSNNGLRVPEADPQLLVCNPAGDAVPEADLTVYFDGVALPASPRHRAALQVARRIDESSGEVSYFAKRGLMFRGPDPITVAVLDDVQGALLNFEGRSESLTIPTGCGDRSDQWNVIVGGYLVPKPMCLTLRITQGGHAQDAEIGVGAPCPGQQPSPEPSDS